MLWQESLLRWIDQPNQASKVSEHTHPYDFKNQFRAASAIQHVENLYHQLSAWSKNIYTHDHCRILGGVRVNWFSIDTSSVNWATLPLHFQLSLLKN